jgi:superfamily II DNA or RNA helicase
MGRLILPHESRVLWLAHRRDLVVQTWDRLTDVFGRRMVGAILAGEHEDPRARIQVGTIQSYLSRERRSDPPTHVVLDEAHHYMADEWREVLAELPDAKVLGLTATPERADGRPLGDIFQELVVAATYSELIAAGHIVRAVVLRPEKRLGSDIAQDPVDAWRTYVPRKDRGPTFCFCARVELAEQAATKFREAGITAEVIHEGTPPRVRDQTLARFRDGATKVIANVNTMTEGIDVPESSVAILARQYVHVGGMLQAAGRVLRAARGKTHATVLDLSGSTHRHGMPDADRDYGLTGRAISGGDAVRHGGEHDDFAQEVIGVPLVVASDPAGDDDSTDLQAEAQSATKTKRRKGESEAEIRARTLQGIMS